MKKKVIIPIIAVVLVLIIGVVSFVIINNNKIVSTITLDINPSIEINLNKNEKVINVIALNDDAKDIIDDNFKGKNIEETLNTITDNLVEKGYANEGDLLEVILYTDGIISDKEFEEKLTKAFREKRISPDIIVVENVTEEDEELAKKYNISPAKVSYIKSIIKENENVNLEDLVNKSVNELKETKETGYYCEGEYVLDGELCYKEVDRKSANNGNVCPSGYMEYNGKCYEETASIEGEKLICAEEFELKEGKCIKSSNYKPVGECANGVLISDENICKEQEYVGYGREYCRDSGRTLYEHKCLATKPSVNGGCLNGDMYYNGKCVNTRDDYYISDWECPDGSYTYNDENRGKCYKDKKTTRPTYKCDEGFVLENNLCVRTEIIKPKKEKSCPSGYTLVNDNMCLNYNKTANKIDGFVCEGENTKLIGKECIIYDVIEAKHN